MNLFYCPDISGSTGQLSPDESVHCVRVMRHRKGDHINLTDGKGNLYIAVVISDSPKACITEVIRRIPADPHPPFTIHIGLAPTKNITRMEWFLEKAVEIGIDAVTPIICERSERKTLKTERLHKLIISTIKQASVPFMPVLNEATSFETFLNVTASMEVMKYIGHCSHTSRSLVKDTYVNDSDVVFLIGPEGDFSQNEIDLAIQHEFIPVKLSHNRLRTETAGIVACHTIHLLNEVCK